MGQLSSELVAGGYSPEAKAGATVAAGSGNVRKVIVAVHGVGEQHSFATIQAVANQFCSFYSKPAAIPLGSFHNDAGTFSVRSTFPDGPLSEFAFAEVYWAKIPRELVSERYTLEEAKKWARTIIARLQLRAHAGTTCTSDDFQLIGNVLTEMVQTIAVLDRLCFLADKAGLFTFDLKRTLDDYLGDVQVVAEFKSERRQILDVFSKTMKTVHDSFSSADGEAGTAPDIYIVAHSEGSVVAFLGLLEGARDKATWVNRVRGLMTIGSPIDKHIVLWPGLFEEFQDVRANSPNGGPIEWRNYYDRGDPIGFELDLTRKWLRDHKWNTVFRFEDKDDMGFDRYTLPAKAHVDYWTDRDVFGNFIQTVVESDELPPEKTAAEKASPQRTRANSFSRPPKDIPARKAFSYIVPYVGVATLLFVAAFILYKAMVGVLVPEVPKDCTAAENLSACKLTSVRDILRHVTGIALLVLGVTVVARIPRLTRRRTGRAIAAAIGLLGGVAYAWSVLDAQPHCLANGTCIPPGMITLTLSAVVIAIAYLVASYRPNWGMAPLIILGTLIVAGKVVILIWQAQSARDIGPIWPVFLATGAFLYLWWLAALLLDLVFVWHVYIRQSKAIKRMCEVLGVDYPQPDVQRLRVAGSYAPNV